MSKMTLTELEIKVFNAPAYFYSMVIDDAAHTELRKTSKAPDDLSKVLQTIQRVKSALEIEINKTHFLNFSRRAKLKILSKYLDAKRLATLSLLKAPGQISQSKLKTKAHVDISASKLKAKSPPSAITNEQVNKYKKAITEEDKFVGERKLEDGTVEASNVVDKTGQVIEDKLEKSQGFPLTSGPRMKSDATFALEEVVRGILSHPTNTSCRYNEDNELEITIAGVEYNLTDILMFQPDFEQLTFSDKELSQYAAFIEGIGLPKFKIFDREYTATEDNYALNDPENSLGHLHYGEKLAITIYSGQEYKSMQRFLRQLGMRENADVAVTGDESSNKMLLNDVKKALLGAAIASHGLSKPESIEIEPELGGFKVLHRGEVTFRAVDVQREKDAQDKKVTSNTGFLSTTSDNTVGQKFAAEGLSETHTTFVTPEGASNMGKEIKNLSQNPHEQEVLYVPGAQTAIIDYKKIDTAYSLSIMTKDNFEQLLKAKGANNRPILIVNPSDPTTYSLWGLKKGTYQLTTLKDFQMPPAWKNSSLVQVRADTDLMEQLKVGHTPVQITEILAAPVRSIDKMHDPHAYTKFMFIKKIAKIEKKLKDLDAKIDNMKNDDIHELRQEFQDLQKSWQKEEKLVKDWMNSKSQHGVNMLSLETILAEGTKCYQDVSHHFQSKLLLLKKEKTATADRPSPSPSMGLNRK